MSEEKKNDDPVAAAVANALASIQSNAPAVEKTEQPKAPAAETKMQTAEDAAPEVIPQVPPSFSGRARDTFCIYGSGFGAAVGSVSLGGFSARLTSWQDHVIKGLVPEALVPGGVELSVNGSTPIVVRLNA